MCRKAVWRENIHTLDRKRRKCSLRSAVILTVAVVACVLFAATNLVRWDTDITFTMPDARDLHRPAGADVSDSILFSPEWQERKDHIIDALKSGCAYNSFAVTTHKSLRVMGSYVHEGIFYICSTNKAYINFELENVGSPAYLCRESYGDATREVRRGTFRMRAMELTTMTSVNFFVDSPTLVCSIGHATDVVRSKWHV